MTVELLRMRSGNRCELCQADEICSVFDITGQTQAHSDTSVWICAACRAQAEHKAPLEARHFFGLKESVWSEFPAVQALSYRLLERLRGESWAADVLSQAYLDDSLLAIAQHDPFGVKEEAGPTVVDSNGTPLSEGDTVTLIKDLEVKGANFTAKRGTTVKGIGLTGDPRYVEGKVNGTQIVLVAAYLKKA